MIAKKLLVLCGAMLAVGIATTQVQATLYTIGYGGLENPNWALGIGASGSDASGVSGSHLVGGIQLTLTGGGAAFNTVCTDVSGTVVLGSSYDFSTVVFEGQTGYNPNWGYTSSSAQAAIQNAAEVFYENKGVLSAAGDVNKVQRAALQLAVWEALYDTGGSTGWDLSKGRFQASGDAAAMSAAIAMLNAALPRSQDYVGYLLQDTGHLDVQEMLFDVTPVPEPTTMIAGALLLLPFGASTLRMLRKNRTA